MESCLVTHWRTCSKSVLLCVYLLLCLCADFMTVDRCTVPWRYILIVSVINNPVLNLPCIGLLTQQHSWGSCVLTVLPFLITPDACVEYGAQRCRLSPGESVAELGILQLTLGFHALNVKPTEMPLISMTLEVIPEISEITQGNNQWWKECWAFPLRACDGRDYVWDELNWHLWESPWLRYWLYPEETELLLEIT